MSKSFITLNRQILEWEWYTDANTMRLFIHCLLKANWKDKNWKGMVVHRGTFVTSQDNLSDQLNLSRKQIQLSFKKLIETGEITKKGHSKYTLVTIVKYDDYQKKSDNEAQQKHSKGTTKAQQKHTTNNNNNENNENNNLLLISNEENFSKVFENEKYIEAFTLKFQMTVERLKELYLEFNNNLQLTNDTVKTNQEYVGHFLNWYCKQYDVDRKTGRKRRKRIPI